MAGTGSIGANFDAGSAYQQSFGNMAAKTVYLQPDVKSIVSGKMKNTVDTRIELHKSYKAGLKAQTTTAGGAGTAGYAMVPIFVDPRIIDETRKNTPIIEMLPRVTNMGMFADYNNITAKGGAFAAAEDAAMTERDNTYDRNSTAIKFLYAVGRVTGPSEAAQPSYILAGMNPSGSVGPFGDQAGPNSMQIEVLVQTRAIKELEENLLINGNASSSAVAGNPDGTEFNGIITLMGSENTVAKGTTALSLNDITTAIQKAFDDGGRPNLSICSSAVFSDLLDLISAKIGFMQSAVETEWGFSAIKLNTMVGQIPVIPSMFMSIASGSKAIYFLDTSVVEVRVLQDLTYENLAKTNDSRKFMLKQYETLIIRNISFCSSITAIA